MPSELADYGIAAFALGVVAWLVAQVFAPRQRQPDLAKLIADNTQALTRLTSVIENQGQMIEKQGEVLQKQAELLTELRVEIVRKVG